MMVISNNAAYSTVNKMEVLEMRLMAKLLNQLIATVLLVFLLNLTRPALARVFTVKAFQSPLSF